MKFHWVSMNEELRESRDFTKTVQNQSCLKNVSPEPEKSFFRSFQPYHWVIHARLEKFRTSGHQTSMLVTDFDRSSIVTPTLMFCSLNLFSFPSLSSTIDRHQKSLMLHENRSFHFVVINSFNLQTKLLILSHNQEKNLTTMAPNIKPFLDLSLENSNSGDRIRCAILGCGMVCGRDDFLPRRRRFLPYDGDLTNVDSLTCCL